MNSNHNYVYLDSQNDEEQDLEGQITLNFARSIQNFPVYRENEAIISQLLQMQFSLRAAMLCAQITGSKDLDYILQFITSDENGYYNHPFLDEGSSNNCIICSDVRSKHVEALDPNQFETSSVGGNMRNSRSASFSEGYQQQKRKVSIEVHPKKPIIDPVTCMVCFEDVERSEIITYDGKMHDICPECFAEYLETQINENKVLKIICPHCSEELKEETIKALVPETIYNKFKKFVRNIQVSSDPLCKWCPDPHCSEVIKLASKNAKKGTCEHCGLEICGKCGRQFHGKSSCEKNVDSELKSWLNATDASKCPKCGMYVEKMSGCNHMTCAVCRYEWCWLCGSTYTSLHFVNPFGCMGLQDGGYRARNWNWCKRTLYRLAVVFAFLIALPFVALLGFPVFFPFWIADSSCYRSCMKGSSCCCKFFFFVFLIIPLGILLNFIIIPLGLVALPFVLLFIIFSYFRERCIIAQRTNENLRNRS